MAKISQDVLDAILREARAIAEHTGLASQGVKIKSVEYIREAGIWYLRVSLAKPSGVSINDCETLHRPLSKRLDEIDPIPEAYYLEVCSDSDETQPPEQDTLSASLQDL